jgi:hypothetical protein
MSATHLGPLIESVADRMVRQDLVARENEQEMDLTYKQEMDLTYKRVYLYAM